MVTLTLIFHEFMFVWSVFNSHLSSVHVCMEWFKVGLFPAYIMRRSIHTCIQSFIQVLGCTNRTVQHAVPLDCRNPGSVRGTKTCWPTDQHVPDWPQGHVHSNETGFQIYCHRERHLCIDKKNTAGKRLLFYGFFLRTCKQAPLFTCTVECKFV